MTLNKQALTRINVDALTSFDLNHLECAESLYLHLFVLLQPILYCLEDSSKEL